VLLAGTVPVSLATEVVFGLQLNDDAADSYGSSMTYDAKTHRLYVTGSTYSGYFKTNDNSRNEDYKSSNTSDCFFGVLQLPTQVFMTPQWIRRVQVGMSDVAEACSSLYVSQDDGEIYLLGHSVRSASVMSPLTIYSNLMGEDSIVHPTATTAGLIMNLDRGANLVGGMVMEANAVQYPVAVDSDADSDRLFVASIKSNNGRINPSFAVMNARDNNKNIHSDMSTAGYLPPEFGSNFTVILKSLKRRRNNQAPGFDKSNLRETLEAQWSREFGLDMPTSLQVSSLMYVSEEILLVAGSTQVNDAAAMGRAGEWDGFILAIDPATGDQMGSQRIRSLPQGDDHVLGLCRSDGSGDDNMYLVGITEGSIDNYGNRDLNATSSGRFEKGAYRAFILKMNARTMALQWISYVGATIDVGILRPPQVHGIACAVTADGKDVYLAGTVKDGAVLQSGLQDAYNEDIIGHGGDDIFVAQYSTLGGKLNWAKQMGTSSDDSLGQGNSIATNANGDAIVLGNTRGSLMRKKMATTTNDMFVLSLARKRGRHLPFYESMMASGATVSGHTGFSKSTNPYYFDPQTDQSDNLPPLVQSAHAILNTGRVLPNESSHDLATLSSNATNSTTSTQPNITDDSTMASQGQQNSSLEGSNHNNSTEVSQNKTKDADGEANILEGAVETNANQTSVESSDENAEGEPPQEQTDLYLEWNDDFLNENASLPINVTFPITTPSPSTLLGQHPNLRTPQPMDESTPPPFLPVVVIGSDKNGNSGEEKNDKITPHVISVVVLANVIIAVGVVLIYLRRQQGGWHSRIVPGLEDKPKKSSSDIDAGIIGEGRWKAESVENRMQSASEIYSHQSRSFTEESLLLNSRPTPPLFMPPLTAHDSFDRNSVDERPSRGLLGRSPSQAISIHSPASFSTNVSLEGEDIIGDRYDL